MNIGPVSTIGCPDVAIRGIISSGRGIAGNESHGLGDLIQLGRRGRPVRNAIANFSPEMRAYLMSHVVEQNGCWIWTGQVDQDGYARTGVRSARTHAAYRVAYENYREPIPPGLTVDHLCHTADESCPGGHCIHRLCINPWHLEPVPNVVNVMRGRSFYARNARKTHCPQGHLLNKVNAYGGRECSVCRKTRAERKRRARGAQQIGPAAVTCSRGHLWAETEYKSGNRRRCRTCDRDRAAAYYLARRAA